jgi:hypothetical protein
LADVLAIAGFAALGPKLRHLGPKRVDLLGRRGLSIRLGPSPASGHHGHAHRHAGYAAERAQQQVHQLLAHALRNR